MMSKSMETMVVSSIVSALRSSYFLHPTKIISLASKICPTKAGPSNKDRDNTFWSG
jgi:hypothetical protein